MLLLGLFGLGSHLIGSEIRSFERKATEDILSLLEGPKKRAWIRTVPEGPFGLLRGNLRRVTIEAQDFTTSTLPFFVEPGSKDSGQLGELRLVLNRFVLGKLRVEHLEAHLEGNTFDFGLAKKQRKVRLTQSGSGPGVAELNANDLADFIPKNIREIKSCTVAFENDEVLVKGRAEFAIIKTEFELRGKLEIRNGIQFWLVNPTIFFDGKPADPLSKDALLRLLNPVLDLNRDLGLMGAIYVKKLVYDKQKLRAEGVAQIPTRSGTG